MRFALLIREIKPKTSKEQWMGHGEALCNPGNFVSNQVEMCTLRTKEQIHEPDFVFFGQSHNFFGRAIPEGDAKSVESLVLNFRLDENWFALGERMKLWDCPKKTKSGSW